MGRLLPISPALFSREKGLKTSLLVFIRAAAFYSLIITVLFCVFFPFKPGMSLADLYWLQLQKGVLIVAIVLLTASWAFNFFLALFYPYPELPSSVPRDVIKRSCAKSFVNFFFPKDVYSPSLANANSGIKSTPNLTETSSTTKTESQRSGEGEIDNKEGKESKMEGSVENSDRVTGREKEDTHDSVDNSISDEESSYNRETEVNSREVAININEAGDSNKELPKNVALIIPTHNSSAFIGDTLKAASKFLPFSSMFVMDNGAQRDEGAMKTENVVNEVSGGLARYYFHPVPNKAANLYLGAICAEEFDFIMLIDDDTFFPEHFQWPSVLTKTKQKKVNSAIPTPVSSDRKQKGEEKDKDCEKGEGYEERAEEIIDDEGYTAYGFSIRAVDHHGERNGLLVRLQDWEYKCAGYRKYVQAQACSTLFHHGAVGLWQRKAYLKTWENHYGLPLGDDRLSGMENLFLGNRMGYLAYAPFATAVPEELFFPRKGVYWTLSKQRIFRWGVANFRHIWMDLYLLLTYFPQFAPKDQLAKAVIWRKMWYYASCIYRWVFFRLFLLFELGSLGITLITPYVLIRYLIANPEWYIIIHAVLYGSGVINGLFLNFILMRKRPDLKTDIVVILLMPPYRYMLRIFRFFAVIISCLCYIPLYPHPERLPERPLVAKCVLEIRESLKKKKHKSVGDWECDVDDADATFEAETAADTESDAECDIDAAEFGGLPIFELEQQ